MATFLEIKQLIGRIFDTEAPVDETSDIEIPELLYRDENFATCLSNAELKAAYEKMNEFNMDKVELYSARHREVPMQFARYASARKLKPIVDDENGLTYTLGPASIEYCMFILSYIADHIKSADGKLPFEFRSYGFMKLKRNVPGPLPDNTLNLLPLVLRYYTLRIDSDEDIAITTLRSRAIAYEFQYMYKQSVTLAEFADFDDMFTFPNSLIEMEGQPSREPVDAPPKRVYNSDVMDFYVMAIESRDPFTKYISFYHVIEYYFDAVFKKKLTDEMRKKMTHPDFSNKSEDKLYELAKYIRKHMNSDDESGKGNEIDSLKYVLNEYVPIVDLKKRIAVLDSNAIAYYQDNDVPFVKAKKTKIAWNDAQGVYKNISNRIYETRNALVHSKSEKIENQYRPYKNSGDLKKEMALIRAVAEQVIINSSSMI